MAPKLVKLGAVGLGVCGWACLTAGVALMQVRLRRGPRGGARCRPLVLLEASPRRAARRPRPAARASAPPRSTPGAARARNRAANRARSDAARVTGAHLSLLTVPRSARCSPSLTARRPRS
jgi:hypothetical protein